MPYLIDHVRDWGFDNPSTKDKFTLFTERMYNYLNNNGDVKQRLVDIWKTVNQADHYNEKAAFALMDVVRKYPLTGDLISLNNACAEYNEAIYKMVHTSGTRTQLQDHITERWDLLTDTVVLYKQTIVDMDELQDMIHSNMAEVAELHKELTSKTDIDDIQTLTTKMSELCIKIKKDDADLIKQRELFTHIFDNVPMEMQSILMGLVTKK